MATEAKENWLNSRTNYCQIDRLPIDYQLIASFRCASPNLVTILLRRIRWKYAWNALRQQFF